MSFGIAFQPKVMKGALNLLGGPALPTQFTTLITPPVAMLGDVRWTSVGSIAQRALSIAGTIDLSVMTESVELPGRRLMTAEIIRHGQHMKMPYGVQHETAKFRFICTNSMIERTFFDMWMSFIQMPDSHYMEYFDRYKTQIIIKKLCGSGILDTALADPFGGGVLENSNNPIVEAGSLLSTYFLEDAYPLSMSSQELSSSNTRDYLTLDVEFAYTHIKSALDKFVPSIFGGPNLAPGGSVGLPDI